MEIRRGRREGERGREKTHPSACSCFFGDVSLPSWSVTVSRVTENLAGGAGAEARIVDRKTCSDVMEVT